MSRFEVELLHKDSPDLGYLSFEQLEEYIDPWQDYPDVAESIAQPIWDALLSNRLGNTAILHSSAELKHFIHSDDKQWISLGELTIPLDDGLNEMINLDTIEEIINTGVIELDASVAYIMCDLIDKRRTKIATPIFE